MLDDGCVMRAGAVMSATALFTTVLLCCLLQQLDCISLAPVYWNVSNPM